VSDFCCLPRSEWYHECSPCVDLNMSLEKRKQRVWGCLVCKSLKNSTLEKKCPTCGAKRETERFAFSQDDVLYLCHVNSARAFPQVTISRLTAPESTTTVNLPLIQDSLLDAVKEAVSNLGSSSKCSHLSSTQSSDVSYSPVIEPIGDSGSSVPPKPSERLDLYHTVMKKARDLEYDAIMGQFVSSEEPKELKYVQSMIKEKETMVKIVQDKILSREDNSPLTKELNVNEDALNEWKDKVPCSLCQHLYPPAQLLGSISNHSILNWMKAHAVSTDTKECKKMFMQEYEAAKLCLFCTQFFDENYSETFDVEISANEEIRSRRIDEKKCVAVTKEDKVIEKMNAKLAIAELKTKKETIRIRKREDIDDSAVSNAERVLKLQEEQRRLLKFQEAKEKFRRHKASLAKKGARTQSAAVAKQSLPSLTSDSKKSRAARKGKGGSVTSRSEGADSEGGVHKSSSDSRLARVRQSRKRGQRTTKKELLPVVSESTRAKTLDEPEGDAESVASCEPGNNDSIDMALNSDGSSTQVVKKKVKKKKKKKVIVNRMTKKEIARLELMKEISEKKEKEEKRYKSRKVRESDWNGVRVGDGGQEKDMKIMRDQEKRAAMLIEEYEREMSNQLQQEEQELQQRQQREVSVKAVSIESEGGIHDRPAWDDSVVKKPPRSQSRPTAQVTSAADDYSESEDDILEIEANDNATQLKPTITLEMLQQHKQHLQSLHLKHLEAHIDSKNLEEESAPPTAEGQVRASITKDMLESHKKHVLAAENKSIRVINERAVPTESVMSQRNIKKTTRNKGDASMKVPTSKSKSVTSNSKPDPISTNIAKKPSLPSHRVAPKRHVTVVKKEAKTPFPEYHNDDIDCDDGFDSVGGPCSSQEYDNEYFEDDSQEVMEDEDMETPMMMDDEEEVKKMEAAREVVVPSSSIDNDKVVLKVRNFDNEGGVDENYEGFDSFMDSLQQKEIERKHSPIATITTAIGSGGNTSTASQAGTHVARSFVLADVVMEEEEKDGGSDEDNYNDVSFDDEDNTHLEVYSAGMRCSPVTVDIQENIEEDIETTHVPNGLSNASTPSRRKHRSSQSSRGSNALRGASRGQLASPGGSRVKRSSHLEQYENVRPNSRTLRPISRSSLCSGGSVRRGSQSSRLEQYDNATPNNRAVDLDASGNLSNSGIFSPPSSAVRRRNRHEGINKLEVVDGGNFPGTPSSRNMNRSRNRSRSGMKRINSLEVVGTPNSKVTSMGSRSGSSKTVNALGGDIDSNLTPNARRTTVRSGSGPRPVNKLEVLSQFAVAMGDGDSYETSKSRRSSLDRPSSVMNESIDEVEEDMETEGTTKLQSPQPPVDSMLRSPKESDRSELFPSEEDDKLLPLKVRKPSAAKISNSSQQIDNTPSMLDMKFKKFSGNQNAKMKRMDSFDRLSKRIQQQQAVSTNVLDVVSPAKMSTQKGKDGTRRRSSVISGTAGRSSLVAAAKVVSLRRSMIK